MRFEIYDINYEVIVSFEEYIDALEYYNNNSCMFVYDTHTNKIVEGSDK